MTSKPSATDRTWSVYIILCRNGSYYTGIALDVTERLRKHRLGTSGSRYTRSFRPRKLLASWMIIGGRGEAQRVEHYIKRSGRAFKEEIIENPGKLAAFALRDLGIRLRRSRRTPAKIGREAQLPLR